MGIAPEQGNRFKLKSTRMASHAGSLPQRPCFLPVAHWEGRAALWSQRRAGGCTTIAPEPDGGRTQRNKSEVRSRSRVRNKIVILFNSVCRGSSVLCWQGGKKQLWPPPFTAARTPRRRRLVARSDRFARFFEVFVTGCCAHQCFHQRARAHRKRRAQCFLRVLTGERKRLIWRCKVCEVGSYAVWWLASVGPRKKERLSVCVASGQRRR